MATLIHPVFLDIAGHVETDEYWKLIYEDMAYGRFPMGAYIQNNHFCCRKNDRECSLVLEGDTFTLFTQIHSLLKNFLGINSEHDRLLHKSKIPSEPKARDETTKKIIKDSVLTEFVIREGKRNNISDIILRKIFSLLIIGFIFKTILVRDVVFQDNDIEKINGFHFTPNKVRINKNILQLKKSHISEVPSKSADACATTTLASHWTKYTHSLSSVINP
jgi:hypothetical protein